ncbi:hypothetical protein BN7_3533 [Wickerhamomyces ciferrii]|uniref:FAD dependent oxidoreductase domain-containing protein n=1 Tax=Wickerhamomyces ciferrii (strain ATCC 14091 / BCRC 22168 / CBS 111 / JCM 3599 / NBRC 0793 / NRRL Y-1031 F-60-10) TaxID=1206466 RepID=K0KRL8_WICCF|nr:uncharacterized protein BN7_3533 [Wickerhamomyces ciferrii]CCH43978.1 hypothetical protein BN7_3533 [Wickerhamomyces ciferrii]
MSEYLTFSSTPSGKAEGKTHIIIVGAGIIGVCTAYYLTRHPDFSPETHHITIIESKRVAGGASGKAGGLLALWAFPQQIVPLSFKLHEELAKEYNGEDEWGYRRLTTVSLEGNIQNLLNNEDDSSSSLEDPKKETIQQVEDDDESEVEDENDENDGNNDNNNDDDDKVQNNRKKNNNVLESTTKELKTSYPPPKTESSSEEDVSKSSELKNPPPKKRTVTKNSIKNEHNLPSKNYLPKDLNWIKQDVIQDWSVLGGRDSTAQVHPYKFTNYILRKAMETGAVELILGKVDEIEFSEDTGEAIGISYIPTKTLGKENEERISLKGDQTVLTVGPWTSKILPDCPISGLRAHSITIAPHNGMVSPYAIFTELKIARMKYVSPEMYARKDEVYVCGEGDTLVDVPETTDDVEVIKEKCDQLFHYVGKLSPNLSKGHILKRQACYLPVLDVPSSSGPLIGETNVENLYLASGHSCWGINNAPGTGKILAELLLEGETHSADISALDPSLYFDASVLVGE